MRTKTTPLLDLRATQKLAEAVSPGYGDYSRLAQETLALLAHCRELRAALRDTASVGTAYDDHLPCWCLNRAYRGPHDPWCIETRAVLASATDGEAA